MLKLEHTIEDPLSNSHGEATGTTDRPFVNRAQSSHLPSPVTISRPLHDEYGIRSSRESVLQRLSEALLRRSLTKIDLSQRSLMSSDARLVRMALSQNENLTVLKLGYNNLCDSGVTTLAAGIALHRSLVLLDLGFNNVGDSGASALAHAMQQAAARFNGGTLHTLYLAGNMIGEDGALALADFIRQGSRLSKLFMTGNRIGAGGVSAIAESILEDEVRSANFEPAQPETSEHQLLQVDRSRIGSFSGMQELFLGGTGMGMLGCNSVARLLETTACLRVISFPNCDIGDDEIGELASSIKANKSALPVESLQLSFNNMTHKGLESLMNALWGSGSLRELKLDNNNIGDRGAHQVAAVLPTLKELKILDIGFNSIKATGLNVLMKVIADSNQLESLSISGNTVDVPAAKAVAYALAYNCSLEALFLVHCTINHEGQRHITAGIVSNARIALRKLTGFRIGPTIVTLGFPEALQHWTNGQVLKFIHLMWNKSNIENDDTISEFRQELDPLNFLSNPGSDRTVQSTGRQAPLEATVVVEVAKKAYASLVANGVDVFSRQGLDATDLSFESPLAGESIMIESPGRDGSGTNDVEVKPQGVLTGDLPAKQARSFVAPPESSGNNGKNPVPDPARKQRIVEWLCSNIQHLNEMSQYPFDSRDLWRLHQHYFTPVVNETGGAASPFVKSDERIVSSVPEVSRANTGGSTFTPSIVSSDGHFSVPISDPVLPGAANGPNSLPMLKRKVSYRVLGDAMIVSDTKFEKKIEDSTQNGSVARMIQHGHTGHSLPPKTKRARRNRTRISFLPRIKEKLDSYLDVCHEKALVTMRQLYFVEEGILRGEINPLDTTLPPRTHLSGILASEAEMIIVDMM
eukprot:CAMPEP_0113620600 /NCGR_PEP_ID=MMETSP0017_2-20120614/10502_1 /TAXON_ID=2856 /ORGANISM="Cylindrotheca closterium" /LENGTH=864 /DNA_ID=CAMNT_0000530277 /DNA_START=116 /DNA_END=2710 /DNA_ORIENTATION=- /assembly_acc=CAM_ASM_000147